MDHAEHVRQQLLGMLAPGPLTADQLNDVLRYLAKYRAWLIQNDLLAAHGPRVFAGPFAGMLFTEGSAEGCHAPKLLGCYERELHPVVEAAVATGYPTVVNIGCAEGYYAVGLARRLPAARVSAFDDNPRAQQVCRALAERNGVADRVTVGGRFGPEMFRTIRGPALVLIDIEGLECELLEAIPPADVAELDLVIECHDYAQPGTSTRLAERFADTHAARLIPQAMPAAELPADLARRGHLDQLLAVWEWRTGPTPWLVLASKRRTGGRFFELVG